jgi:ABC-type multidrug transport system fused ATPase/permease subunit
MRNLVTVIGALVILFVTSWKLTLVMLAVVPVITAGAIVYGNFIKKLQAKFQDELAASVAIASESLGAIRTVRTFVREGRLQEDFRFGLESCEFLLF